MTDSATAIEHLHARRIWDSRGRPTLEVDVRLRGQAQGRGVAPAGASRGSHEATDLRDGGLALGGLDVQSAIAHVNGEIARALIGMDACDQAAVDARLIELDGTDNKSRLGGNATIAVSLGVLHAAADSQHLPLWKYIADGAPVRLPLPEVQIFGGGAHAGRRIDIQDLMVMPVGAGSFDEAMVMVAEVYRAAGDEMLRRGRRCGVADEGGWWPDFASNEEALETLTSVIDAAGYRHGEVLISLDIAASEFGASGRYALGLDHKTYDTDGWLDVLDGWMARYPILSVEDPVAEDDTAGMQRFTAAFGQRVQVIGDDYLVSNASRVARAAGERACNAVLLKPNQAGTVTETLQAWCIARDNGMAGIVSARSGETEDVAIVHLAVGWNTGQLKVGSFARSERMAKWNEALRIEERLGRAAPFAGRSGLPVGLRDAG